MHSGDTYRLAGTVLSGRYRVERAVAEGGFGVVYCGLHLSLEKRIAIKVLKLRQDVSPKLRASIATKFRREAQTLAKLSHPALVQALDLDMSVMPNGDEAPLDGAGVDRRPDFEGGFAFVIERRAGHHDPLSTRLYVREAEAIGDAFGDAVPTPAGGSAG